MDEMVAMGMWSCHYKSSQRHLLFREELRAILGKRERDKGDRGERGRGRGRARGRKKRKRERE